MDAARDYWTERQAEYVPYDIDPPAYLAQASPLLRGLLTSIGDCAGMTVLDLGCGNGDLSVYAARCGATVWAVDYSSSGVRNTEALAEHNGVGDRVHAVEKNAMAVGELDARFDLVIGKNVLHHLEPFHEFVETLHDILEPEGRATFIENSARNRLLMFARAFCGRFGIPKLGDAEPAAEIGELRRRFPVVKLTHPTFICFRMLATYVFRRNRGVLVLFRGLDNAIAAVFPFLRRYSYWQIIGLAKQPGGVGA